MSAAQARKSKDGRVIDESGSPVVDDTVVDLPMETATITWRGIELQIPASIEDWPAEALEAFEQNKAMTGVHAVLGDDQWQRVSAGRRIREVVECFELIGKAAGFEQPGE